MLATDPRPARDRRKVSTATKTLRRCSTAQTLPDAESYARVKFLACGKVLCKKAGILPAGRQKLLPAGDAGVRTGS